MLTAEQLVALAERGNQQRIRLRDGRCWQGWIMEVNDTDVILSTGSGEVGKDVTLGLADIDPAGLAYWDFGTQSWTPFLPPG